tara:strand:- start:9127 stop:9306 length:180 start_codon:yes stop_codon:yes gene_type:complete
MSQLDEKIQKINEELATLELLNKDIQSEDDILFNIIIASLDEKLENGIEKDETSYIVIN